MCLDCTGRHPAFPSGQHAESDDYLIIARGGIIVKSREIMLKHSAEVSSRLCKHDRVKRHAAWNRPMLSIVQQAGNQIRRSEGQHGHDRKHQQRQGKNANGEGTYCCNILGIQQNGGPN